MLAHIRVKWKIWLEQSLTVQLPHTLADGS